MRAPSPPRIPRSPFSTHRLVTRAADAMPSIFAIALIAVLAGVAQPAFGQFTFTDVNPDNSNLDPTDPVGASGGRVRIRRTVSSRLPPPCTGQHVT